MRWGRKVAVWLVGVLAWTSGAGAATASAPADEAGEWVTRFAFVPPAVETTGVCEPAGAYLLSFSVVPTATGRQLVRGSLPFAPGTFPAELGLLVLAPDDEPITPDVRVLTRHPGQPVSVRRAIITFVYEFHHSGEHTFQLALGAPTASPVPPAARQEVCEWAMGGTSMRLTERGVELRRGDQSVWVLDVIAPPREWSTVPTVEIIEQGRHYLWARMLLPDARWPRIIELRADALGTVAVRLHLQRLEASDGKAPEMGWRIASPTAVSLHTDDGEQAVRDRAIEHSFAAGRAAWITTPADRLSFPDAHLQKRGSLAAVPYGGGSQVAYLRCRADERVPHQHAAWRTACVAIGPREQPALTPLLEPPHRVRVSPAAFDAIYPSDVPDNLAPWPVLQQATRFHLDAIASGTLLGDDFGNVTYMPHPSVFGMNRLNHCPAIFHAYYRSGDARLRDVGLLWCDNFHDLSIWWGTAAADEFGGTRYNSVAAEREGFRDDKSFMWRSNSAVTFCTKGYDSFFYAYEETGDPRMGTALRWQTAYAGKRVHADEGECRNIGDVLDFVRLYEFTGKAEYLDHALRLFRELRARLSPGDLFSQGGAPIVDDPPFIDDDEVGYKHPFAKPYIIGYGLAGLPALARHHPDEPKLRDVIRAVADFLAGAEDPVGGWRYPHPRSSRVLIGFGMEQAAQLARAAGFLEARGEPIDRLLDAIESVLQSRILSWQKSGAFLGNLGGWEQATGALKDGQTTHDLYRKPADRDPGRDHAEGAISLGDAPPEGVVYFWEVLDFYLGHRPAERLFHANRALQSVLNRIKETGAGFATTQPTGGYVPYGVENKLPTFRDALVGRLDFPLAFGGEGGMPFGEWRRAARAKLLECLLVPPPRAEFAPLVIAREDRGGYEARKMVFNVSGDGRVPAYLLVPKGEGPFPAMICLHDHGAHFSIGKEKVVRPFDTRDEIVADAQRWVERYYGGRFIGDELAQRGYVVFAMDALFWGERGQKEGSDYESQQALSANLLQMGMTWIGVITWDDVRSAEFVASLPEVDPARIGAVGLSMGSHRAWMLSAATDRIAAGVAVCWLGTTEALTSPGNNQTKGQSAYSMLVPDLRNYLDYPDVAAIACPKPMMFYNGERDGLFPVEGVEVAYARMRRVWESQGAGDKLVTRMWPTGHVFNAEMQAEAFAWLDRYLRPKP